MAVPVSPGSTTIFTGIFRATSRSMEPGVLGLVYHTNAGTTQLLD